MPRGVKDPNAWFQKALKVAQDPAASGWLKNALVAAINRDPVDAAGDAEVLCRILQLRAVAAQRGPALSDAAVKSSKAVS
jgi:lysozyme family protein